MKFEFTPDFQFDILRYTVQDKNGYKAIELYEDSYFTLLEHAVITYTLKRYYKKRKSIPQRSVLLEELNDTFNHKDFINHLTEDDRKEILQLTDDLYKGVVKDGDEILERIERFAQYVSLKDEIENVNLLDYNSYDSFSQRIQKAISPKLKTLEDKGSFLVKDISHRQARRKEHGDIIPMPWFELDRLTNAGGYSKGSILVILDKAKKFKTGALINIARRYMQYQKKNVLIIDLDNGEGEVLLRLEQSLSKTTKSQLLDDEDQTYQKKVRRILKKSKIHGGEIIVKRFPSLVTTANDISNYIDYLYREFGFQTDILIIDYIAKMGAISGKDSLHERISEAYIDISNLGLKHNIDLIWTAQHVTREAAKVRMKSVYEATDVAGAIDITRHVQAIFGLNRNPLEEENGYQRLEIIDQRDGPPSGRVVFNIDISKQIMDPIPSEDVENYYTRYYPKGNEDEESVDSGYKRRKKKTNDLDVE